MSDNDPIRRGDALAKCGEFGLDVVGLRYAIAALPAVAPAVRVKPLVWEPDAERPADYPKWTADTELGKTYFVFKARWGTQDKWGFAGIDGFHHSIEAAQAAAEADYRARIAASLDLDKILALVEAATRQTDNLAFLLNHAEIPNHWYEKLVRECEEDRAALAALGEREEG